MKETPADPKPSALADRERALRRQMLRQRLGVALILGLLVAACTTIYFRPPEEYVYYPGCTLNRLTGLHCPGCGGTRAVSALMHGDILQAAAYNLYFVLALPFLVWYLGYGVWATIRGKWYTTPHVRPLLFTFIWVSLIAFAVLRNVPVSPFNWMAPHKLEANAPAPDSAPE
jgi:Protein of unknown function (DUF2752)